MPVRLLNSAVFKWPDRDTVLTAARAWAIELRAADADVETVGCVGSYPRGDWGVGSDLDVIIILSHSTLTPGERYCKYAREQLPVPVDMWVYTREEWDRMAVDSPGLAKRLRGEWLTLA